MRFLLIAPLLLQPPAPLYRGFTPGMPYRAFSDRARAIAAGDALSCNTSVNTAQLMECGVLIRDPMDGARFYLSAYVIEGKVAMLSFSDSGDIRLVDRVKRDLTLRFGPPQTTKVGSWEWRAGARATRLSWRADGRRRWVIVNLTDYDLLNGISRYVKRSPS